MFIQKPKETIIHKDDERRYIELCVYCDTFKRFSNKWEKEGYSISHKVCEECSELHIL